MQKNILLRANILICLIITTGFLVTAVLSYRVNYDASIENIEQVSALTSEGIYYQMLSTLTKPVNISLTMANDRLLKDFLGRERERPDDGDFIETLRKYLAAYRTKYGYDSVFLVSAATGRYYTFNGFDRTLERGDPENEWYFGLLDRDAEYEMNVDNDEVAGAGNEIRVFVNCKICDEQGDVLGVIGVGVCVDSLQALLRGYEERYGVEAYLVDDEGVIQISTEYNGYERVSLFDLYPYVRETQDQLLGWSRDGSALGLWASGAADQLDYVVVRYIRELDWRLMVERSTGTLKKKLGRQLWQTCLVIGVIIGSVLLVVTYVIRSFNRRIVDLAQSIERERHALFERTTGQMFDNIYELDITNNCPANRVTEQYFESLGAPPGTPYDKALRIVAEKQIKEEFRQGYLDTFSTQNVLRAWEEGREKLRCEFMIRSGGDYYWMRITGHIVHLESDGSLHLLAYRQNIDMEKRHEKRMLELAQTDEMTGLYTKSATQRLISRILREDEEQLYAFFIFDIDNFKQANDLFGHAFGDSVIRAFTRTIRRHFCEGDLIGRLGGDEFAAFIPAPGLDWVRVKAAELSAALDCLHCSDGMSWKMSASIGVSSAPRDGGDFETLYRRADTALYESKRRGKNDYTIWGGEI